MYRSPSGHRLRAEYFIRVGHGPTGLFPQVERPRIRQRRQSNYLLLLWMDLPATLTVVNCNNALFLVGSVAIAILPDFYPTNEPIFTGGILHPFFQHAI